jgi:hypothetical protein
MRRERVSAQVVIIGVVLSAIGCAGPQRPAREFSDAAEAAEMRGTAEKAFRVSIPPDAKLRSEANFIGFRSNEVLFSRRLDSRTFLVQDLARREKATTFSGTDKELVGFARQVLSGLGIPESEIASDRVSIEKGAVGHLDGATGRVVTDRVEEGRHRVELSRTIDGIQVFSSRALLELNGERRIQFMEMHWPVIPEATLAEARRLAFMVRSGWRPPELEAALVESVEVGILHSPAVGFVMDFAPAVRVVYKPLKSGLGKKPVTYLDRNGSPVPMPRQFAQCPSEPPKRGPAGGDAGHR